MPTSVMNFPEGTRFTPEKHRAQHSPYRRLLKPRAGALALSLAMLGERFDALLDVTIAYPGGAPTFWRFLCGEVPAIVVRARRVAIPAELAAGDYAADPKFRKAFQRWLAALWRDKDDEIEALLPSGRTSVTGSSPPVDATRAAPAQKSARADAPT